MKEILEKMSPSKKNNLNHMIKNLQKKYTKKKKKKKKT